MRYTGGAIGVAVGVCMWVGAGTAAATEPPTMPAAAAEAPLAFTDTEGLQVSCATLAEGVDVGIRNETAVRQDVNLVPVEFSSGGTPVGAKEVCGGLQVEVASALEGGRGTTATLRAAEATEGEFSGSLSLYAGQGRVARREVSISAKAPAETLELEPTVESQTAKLEGSARGPIWVPVKDQVEEAKASSDEGGSEPVGVVSGSNGIAAVVYSGETERLNGTASKVELELEADLDPGAYSGTVDLDQSDEEKGNVKLEVKIAAYWWIAALLLVAGIAVGLVLQWLAGRMIPRARLRGRIQGLSARHEEALTQLTRAAGKDKKWGKFKLKDIDSLEPGRDSLKKELETRLSKATGRVLIKIDAKVLESLEAAIAVVEAQIDLLKEIPEHAEDLEAEREKLPRDLGLPVGDGAQDRPSLYAEAGKALEGEPVRADVLKLRIEEIDTRAKLVRTLLGLEDRLGDLRMARKTLEGFDDPKLQELDAKLGVIRYLLGMAETAEDLATAATEIQNAAKMMAELWQKLHPAAPHPPPEVLRSAFLYRPSAAAAEAPSPSQPPPLPPPPPQPRLDAESAEREVQRAFVAQLVAVAVAALVAIASGLIFLYAANETWGSCWDYVAAAIWGLGAQASVSTLATSLDGLGALSLPRRAA